MPGKLKSFNAWQRREAWFRQRGYRFIGRSIAIKEWNAAAKIWDEFIQPVDGWTVDFGAGNGGFWNHVTNCHRLVLSDIGTGYKLTGREFARVGADAVAPPFKDESLSCVVALGLIEYIDDIDELFRNWRRLVKDNASLLITNSPPVIQNKLRRSFGFCSIVRSDNEVISTMKRTGWKLIPDSVTRAGWQTILAARAV